MIANAGYLGDFAPGDVVSFMFTTPDPDGGWIPATLDSGAVKVHHSNNTTDTNTGVTLTVDFDGVTGTHHVNITTVSDGTFYAAGRTFHVLLSAGDVVGKTRAGTALATFSIANRYTDVKAISGDTGAADNLEAMLDGTGGVDLTLRKATLTATSNDNALTLTGSGTGAGILATGGATGQGIKAAGGATSGAGLLAIGANGNANGATFTGQGSAAGVQITGGATGHGLIALGGGTSGNGARFAANGSGDGASFVGATNGDGIDASGAGTGSGILSTGGATGHGVKGAGGGTSGDGFNLTVTGASNSGIKSTGGASGFGLDGTQNGNITGSLSGSVGSVATGGITAASIATGAIDADSLAADAVDKIIDDPVEGVVTLRHTMRRLLAWISGQTNGGDTTTINFRDQANTKNRLQYTVDADGNRSLVATDDT